MSLIKSDKPENTEQKEFKYWYDVAARLYTGFSFSPSQSSMEAADQADQRPGKVKCVDAPPMQYLRLPMLRLNHSHTSQHQGCEFLYVVVFWGTFLRASSENKLKLMLKVRKRDQKSHKNPTNMQKPSALVDVLHLISTREAQVWCSENISQGQTWGLSGMGHC